MTENTTVCAVFTTEDPETYAVTLTKEGEGKVDISGADNLGAVVTGSKLTVTATPADGWEIVSITANGKDITTDKSFVVTSNTIVKVVFKKLPPKTYAVTLAKEGEGKVAISGSDNLGAVVTGSKLTVTATPADGWEISSITANGRDITTEKSFVVTSNTLVRVVFKKQPPKTYALTLTTRDDYSSIFVVFPNGDEKELEAGKPISVPAGTKLNVKVYFYSQYRYVASMTANEVDILKDRSFVVTQDTALKVVSAPTLSTRVNLTGRGKVSVTVADGRKKVYTLQDKPDRPDDACYILASIGALDPGTKLTVTAEPADGWELEGITAYRKDITASKTFTVTSDTDLYVFFRKKTTKTYKVTVVCSEGGSIELKRHNRVFDRFESVDLDRVPEGTYLTAFSNPNEGYELSECLFNGILRGGGVINKDTEVRAVFRPKYSTNKNKSNF
ncbi:InlB B-repeat-containing protein [Porphyromonas uenonis]|uniref:InlB B-repeat-containing protein n=1 Tax=Porphyromonas uenonis TaxID=281920 RepID=UPI000308064A|nr:hypothetical protein [Porphyromonas uenonis]